MVLLIFPIFIFYQQSYYHFGKKNKKPLLASNHRGGVLVQVPQATGSGHNLPPSNIAKSAQFPTFHSGWVSLCKRHQTTLVALAHIFHRGEKLYKY